MKPRDVRVPLYDMLRAADAIAEFTEGHTFEQYAEDLLLRSAVERQFEILGEAMGKVLRIEPDLAAGFDEAQGVIDFRNVIAHGYDKVSDRVVWDVATGRLTRLRREIAALLQERG
ncbi:MAG: DUF86 domain-containing protein [Actinomycetota bacterium]|nr:DUF86 domain-containing protein [Actinomycetota bacterium]